MKNEQEAVLAAILNTAVDAIIVMDGLGIVRTVNASTEKMFGYEKNEIVGQNIRMLMPTPYQENHDHYLSQYRKEGKRNIIGIGREVSGQRKDGTTFPLHLAVSELSHNNEVLFTGILRDISDLKAVQDQLAQANEDLAITNEDLEARIEQSTTALRQAQAELVRKGKLATLGHVSGGIAHEIRNPLNAVKTSVYYIQHAKNLSPEKLNEHLDRIDRQVTVVDSVVTALADVARLPEPEREACRLDELLQQSLLTTTLGNGVSIENQITADVPDVLVDSRQLPIVFRNVFRNARDAMPNGGTIQIMAETTPDAEATPDAETTPEDRQVSNLVWVRVTDTGTGIEESELARITEPFFTTKARGMGLGLAITKAIIDKNHGKFTVTSQVGQGTTVRIGLPIAMS